MPLERGWRLLVAGPINYDNGKTASDSSNYDLITLTDGAIEHSFFQVFRITAPQ